MTPPDSPRAASHTRRGAFAVLGGSLLTFVLAACAGGEPVRRGGRGRRRDDVPFWQREEQRDD